MATPIKYTVSDRVHDQIKENQKSMNHRLIYDYTKQMAENHTTQVDKNFWMVVKQKPKWMPSFLYRAVIKNLIEFQQYR